MQLPAFVLYGLIGCPHCVEAEAYFRKIGIPFVIVVANEDPIIDEGIKKFSGKEIAEYPVLLYKTTKDIVIGYNPEKYEQLVKSFYALASSSAPSIFGGQQPNIAPTA